MNRLGLGRKSPLGSNELRRPAQAGLFFCLGDCRFTGAMSLADDLVVSARSVSLDQIGRQAAGQFVLEPRPRGHEAAPTYGRPGLYAAVAESAGD